MKRRAEADRGLEETGTRMLLVSVRPRLPALGSLVLSDQVKGGTSSQLQGPGGGPAGSAQLHKSLSPDTGGSLEGKRLTQLPALCREPFRAAPASSRVARNWNWLQSRRSPAGLQPEFEPFASSGTGL